MKIASWNVNGIRSVYQKGFKDWFFASKLDIVCVQEIKAHPDQLEEELLHPKKFHSFWVPAQKKGYSGVAIYTKTSPLNVEYGLGISHFDSEGRVLILEYPDFFLINSYFPNSQRDHARLPYKLEFCNAIHKKLIQLRKKKPVLICGDFNIAHKEIDLRNPKENVDNAGFLPEERAWMDHFVSDGFVDTFRISNPSPLNYTWWSYRPTIRERNIGWRLDYFFCDQAMQDRIKIVTHFTKVLGSDHCPVLIELKN